MVHNRQTINILIAHSYPIFCDGLRKLLEDEAGFRVVGQTGAGKEAVKLVHQLRPDILLLDLDMPRLHGLEILRALTTSSTHVRTIALTEAIERSQMVEVLQLGVRGVLMKDSTTQLLFKSIRSIMAGEYWVGRENVSNLVETLRILMSPSRKKVQKENFGLTSRELEIVSAILSGHTNKEIAEKLSVSEQTVKHHLTNIFDKLGVSNRLELALFAINHRLSS